MTIWFPKQWAGQLHSWFCFAQDTESEKFEAELLCFDMLFINKFYIKK